MSLWRTLMSALGRRTEVAPTEVSASEPALPDLKPDREPDPDSTRDSTAADAARTPRRTDEAPEILGHALYYPGGVLASAMPTADVRIQGVPCAADRAVSFHRNGQLWTTTLARTHAIEGGTLPAGTLVVFDADGRLSGWSAVREDAVPIRIRTASEAWIPIVLPAGSPITIERGQLRSVVLGGPLAFDDLAFPADTELIFGDSGSLSHVTCPEAIELRGLRWAADEAVVFVFGHLSEGYPDADGTFDGVPFRAGGRVGLHDNGRLAYCDLAQDTVLSNVPCAEGTQVDRDDAGNLLEATLASDTRLCGVPVAAGSTVGLQAGVPTALTPHEDCELDGILCARGALVELTTTGRLVRATLARDAVLDHWRLPAGSIVVLEEGRLCVAAATDATTPDGRALTGLWRIALAADGAIRSLLPTTHPSVGDNPTVREAVPIGGLTAAARSNVELRPDGTVRSLVLASDQRVGSWLARGGTRVHFHDDQSPSNVYLSEAADIDGVPCAAARTSGMVINGVEHTYREQVRLSPSGALLHATLAADTTLSGVPLAGGQTVTRWPNGSLHVATLAARWTHPDGYVAREHTLLALHEDGSPSLITLAEPFVRADTEYPTGTVLRFEPPGVVSSSETTHVPLGPCVPIEPGDAP